MCIYILLASYYQLNGVFSSEKLDCLLHVASDVKEQANLFLNHSLKLWEDVGIFSTAF
jgi:hypothetical protein